MDNPFQSPVILSFCPGILGLERGLARAGVKCRVAAYVEIEAFIIANLVAGMEEGLLDSAPIWTNAETFPARYFHRKVHGIIGGYPCPGESLAGLREKHLYKGFLWPSIRRSIAAIRPLWCFFENVDDHLTGTYPIVKRSLRNLGYKVEEGVYSAEECGASQERQRLFILALANVYSWGRTLQDLFDQFEGRTKIIGAGEELAYGYSNGHGAEPGGFTEKGQEIEGETQWEKWDELLRERMRGITWNSGSEMANNNQQRGLLQTTGRFATKQFTQWVAPQGSYQHEWEEPRTIEPGLGCTINGYNFRGDLLRALGNSVVEQTAELAFKDLIRKHIENSKK